METNRNVIGEVNIQVNAGLYVDQQTAEVCMDLLSIHFRNRGYSGMILRCCEDTAHPEIFAVENVQDINIILDEIRKR